jgi:hypothetical protein
LLLVLALEEVLGLLPDDFAFEPETCLVAGLEAGTETGLLPAIDAGLVAGLDAGFDAGFDADVLGFVPEFAFERDPVDPFLLPGFEAGRVVVIFTRSKRV